MKSDKSFFVFLRARPGFLKIFAILMLGVLLIVFSSGTHSCRMASDIEEGGLEQEISEACSSLESVGRCRVMVTYTEEGEVFAVAVLCEGAEKDSVRADVVRLCTSLFGIGANRVSVLKIK